MSSKIVKLPKLYHWQQDTLNVIEANPGKWFVIKSVRQKSGKTYLLENLLIKTALEKPGSKSFCISPVNAQNLRVFTEISKAILPLASKVNSSTMTLEFKNGSVIYFKSAESGDSLRGYTVKRGGILVVDEACFVSQSVYEIILPLVSKEHCTLVLASTPDNMSGFFYETWNRGLDITQTSELLAYAKQGNIQADIIKINWTEYINEMYTQDELDFYRGVYSSRRFRTEILGEFAIGEGSVFTNVTECVSSVELVQSGSLYAGIDFASGQGQDSTVLTLLDSNTQVIKQFSTNDMSPVDQVNWLGRLLNEYKPIRVLAEKNSIGTVYLDMLKSKYPKVTPWITTNDSKTEIIDQLASVIEQGKIKFQPNCTELLSELQVFKESISSTGKRIFSAPTGKHDDRVMSLAIALKASRSGNYSFSIS